MNIYFDPLYVACKSVTGGVAKGKTLQLNVFLLKDGITNTKRPPQVENCEYPSCDAYLLFAKDGCKEERLLMQKTPFGWSISFSVKETGLYYYAFATEKGFICENYGIRGSFMQKRGNSFQLTVYDGSYQTPEWFKGGVMYQIFPDRFAKDGSMPDIIGRVRRADWGGQPSFRPNKQGKVLNNDFFGGNFKGIEKKLTYLEELGVTTVYLNPIFQAASNHRYDTSDYMKTDAYLGTEEDFANLVESAKNKGISVILDGVFNHTGDDSVYFNKYGRFPSLGAYQSKNSPYYSWYSFSNFPDSYESWWGIDILPQVNEKSEEYQEFIFGESGVLKKWLKFGIGGYRLDVADELPDFFLKKLRKSVKEANANAIVIGEVWEDASNKIAYSERREYLHGFELDSVMNYPLKDAIIRFILDSDAQFLSHTVRTLTDHYPKQTLDCLMNILGTHDTARILTVFGEKPAYSKEEMADSKKRLTEREKGIAMEKLKRASVLQYTLPGVPCVFYGDENGQEGYSDPFCRGCFDWENQNVELFAHYKRLGEIRQKYREIFRDGRCKEIYAEKGCYCFKREQAGKELIVCVNNSNEEFAINCKGAYTELFSGKTYRNAFTVNGLSYGIFVKNNQL